MTIPERRNMVFKARLCKFCLDNKYIHKKSTDRHEGCPAFAKKQSFTCKACKTHFLVCEQHANINQEKLEVSRQFWTDKGKLFSSNMVVLTSPVKKAQISNPLKSSEVPQVHMPHPVTPSSNAVC